MTAPEDLVEVEVAPEQVRPGDYLVTAGDAVSGPPDPAHSTDEHVAIPTKSGGGYALIRRGVLTLVRRPRSATTLAAGTDPLAAQLAEVRDLALALADQAGADNATGTAAARARVRARAEQVRARLQEDTTDGTAGPDAPVLGRTEPAREPAEPAPAGPAAVPAPVAPVEPPRSPGAPQGRR